jgi:hypothetical protein
MRISVSADELTEIAGTLVGELARRGHQTLGRGVLGKGEREDWAWVAGLLAAAQAPTR